MVIARGVVLAENGACPRHPPYAYPAFAVADGEGRPRHRGRPISTIAARRDVNAVTVRG
jgi:hypothetical protein